MNIITDTSAYKQRMRIRSKSIRINNILSVTSVKLLSITLMLERYQILRRILLVLRSKNRNTNSA